MGPQRFEVESEAWYRAVAEGRVGAVSDPNGARPSPPQPTTTTIGTRPPSR